VFLIPPFCPTPWAVTKTEQKLVRVIRAASQDVTWFASRWARQASLFELEAKMGGEGASGDAKKTDPNFMGVALKGWAVFAVSLLVVAFAAGHFGFKLYDDWQEALKDKAELADKVKKAAAINQDTSAYSNAITKEMDVHRNDGSGHHVSLHKDKNGETVATFFDSDGCIAIARPGVPLPYMPQPQASLEWSLGPGKRPPSQPPTEALPLGAAISSSALPIPNAHGGGHLLAVGETISDTKAEPDLPISVQAGCWNDGPHPWAFTTWWGPANGCWAPFYRRWNDGCTHYQMFNTCSGQWDPRIYWTFCNPQHHP
jgi:hypothetical protein